MLWPGLPAADPARGTTTKAGVTRRLSLFPAPAFDQTPLADNGAVPLNANAR